MQYFVRSMKKHKDSDHEFSQELTCADLGSAREEAQRLVRGADPAVRLQADACTRNGGRVSTRYRCWVNERGEFQERWLV